MACKQGLLTTHLTLVQETPFSWRNTSAMHEALTSATWSRYIIIDLPADKHTISLGVYFYKYKTLTNVQLQLWP